MDINTNNINGDVDTANQNVKSAILTYAFYIAIILYGTSIYFAENKNNPMYNSMNYLFWLTIVLCEFFWGGFSYLAGQPNALGKSALAVFTTWTVLFVPMFTINIGQSSSNGLNFAEELNSIFSNVVGYYWVSREANDILAQLNAIDIQNPTTVGNNDLISAKILYSEIRNNKTLIINQLTPSNFDCIWDKLFKYLFELAGHGSENNNKIREQLRNIVLQKYAIGKSFWYFYTAIICYTLSIYFMSIL